MRFSPALTDFARQHLAPLPTHVSSVEEVANRPLSMLDAAHFNGRIFRGNNRMTDDFGDKCHCAEMRDVQRPVRNIPNWCLGGNQLLRTVTIQRVSRRAKRRNREFASSTVATCYGPTASDHTCIQVVQQHHRGGSIRARFKKSDQSLVDQRVILENQRPMATVGEKHFLNPSMRQGGGEFRIGQAPLGQMQRAIPVNFRRIQWAQPFAAIDGIKESSLKPKFGQPRLKLGATRISFTQRDYKDSQIIHRTAPKKAAPSALTQQSTCNKHPLIQLRRYPSSTGIRLLTSTIPTIYWR